MLRSLLLIALCCIHQFAFTQQKTLTAVKCSHAPLIDGDLSDPSWQTAPVASNFIQSSPAYGFSVSANTEVKILYDDEAIYVGAYMYDDPAMIRKQLTARDGEQQQDVDYFSVFLDTYNDNQNGFQFLVTSANVQTDARLTPTVSVGFGQFGDKTWDAVWESQVKMQKDGWSVELRIPYISLRFAKKDIQTWGLQFLRYMRRNSEQDFWNNVDPNVSGFVNQFGKYTELKNIQPPLRLSFYPYLQTGVRVNEKGNDLGTQWLRSGGLDVKYGINESFTLDATVIPDFGQTVSDDVINNLTPFEQKFVENRAFFTEGTELFNKGQLFYSRRIGAVPPGYYAVDRLGQLEPDIKIIKNPSVTRLYNAIKFSGRTREKLGIGVFNAVTAPMHAIVENLTTHERTRTLTAPLTNYNIVVLDQALRGRSFITFTNTNTMREGAARDANVSALDLSLYDKRNLFNVRSYGRYSKIFNSHNYDGFNAGLKLGKVSGKLQYFLQGDIKSAEYDPRDLGFLQAANVCYYTASFSYRQLTPTKNFINYSYSIRANNQRIYKPAANSYSDVSVSGFWYFKNFWDVTLTLGGYSHQHDYFVLGRDIEGVYVNRPSYGYVQLNGSTDSRKKLFFSYNWQQADFFNAEPDKNYHIIETSFRYRFSNKLNVTIGHRHESEKNYIVNSGKTDPSGEPIIGFVNFKDVSVVVSGIYSFAPRLNLNFRMRHNWSKVPYNSFATVNNKGEAVPHAFIDSLDENVNFFNIDAFLSWDFKLGCNLTIGYKNWIGDAYAVNGFKYTKYFENFGKVINAPHGNELTVKFIYFIDYNQLRKKR
jgi:hypothetical protein